MAWKCCTKAQRQIQEAVVISGGVWRWLIARSTVMRFLVLKWSWVNNALSLCKYWNRHQAWFIVSLQPVTQWEWSQLCPGSKLLRLYTWFNPEEVRLPWYYFVVATVLNRDAEQSQNIHLYQVHLQKVIFQIAQMLPDKCPGNSQYFHCRWHIRHHWDGGQTRAQMGTPPSLWRWHMRCRSNQTSTCDWWSLVPGP